MSRAPWLIAVAAIAVVGCDKPVDQGQRWTCPMHPQYTSDKPGACPICGMKLVRVRAADGGEPATRPARADRRILHYRSPMDPRQTSPVPKKDEMGMDYVPVFDEVAPSSVRGYAAVDLDPERRRVIGLRTVTVTRGPLSAVLRATGRVVVDETRVHAVTARVEGYVERLQADFTGKRVNKGDPLLSIYSPELLATEEELLLAKRAHGTLSEAGLPDMAESARARLRLLGVPASEIAELDRRGTARPTLTFTAPISGYLLMKNVVAGSKVAPDLPLFSIADLSRVWVLAEVYESDLARVKLGQSATVSTQGASEPRLPGRVSFVDPTVDDKTRTVKVRIVLDNPKLVLKPDQFVDVSLHTETKLVLLLADDAVLNTGQRHLVFVSVGDGRLQPREIEIGAAADGKVEIKRGLAEGEEVAAGASFLLDSESRLKAVVDRVTAIDGGQP